MSRRRGDEPEAEEAPRPDEEPAEREKPEPEKPAEPEGDPVAGVLDILPNGVRVPPRRRGRGRLRLARPDPPLRAARRRRGRRAARGPPRRNERHPSLVRVETVNGRDAEPPEERPLFSRPHARHPDRAAAGAGGARLRALRQGLARGHRRRPRRRRHPAAARARGRGRRQALGRGRVAWCSWAHARRRSPSGPATRGAGVTGGSFDRSTEAQAQAAELAVERAKRVAERGGDALVVVDSLEALPARRGPARVRRGPQHRGRRLAHGGRGHRRWRGSPSARPPPGSRWTRRPRTAPRRCRPRARRRCAPTS